MESGFVLSTIHTKPQRAGLPGREHSSSNPEQDVCIKGKSACDGYYMSVTGLESISGSLLELRTEAIIVGANSPSSCVRHRLGLVDLCAAIDIVAKSRCD
jgi:hypothetical protein